jgi:hypothetical protein
MLKYIEDDCKSESGLSLFYRLKEIKDLGVDLRDVRISGDGQRVFLRYEREMSPAETAAEIKRMVHNEELRDKYRAIVGERESQLRQFFGQAAVDAMIDNQLMNPDNDH